MESPLLNNQLINDIFIASEGGNLQAIKTLTKDIPLQQIINKLGSTPLHLSSWKGHYDCCVYFIENGVNVNSPNNELTTPLHCASERGHFEIVKLLYENGANVNSTDKYGYTPLHYSNRNGHHVCSLYLIDHGADTETRNQNGETPLDIAETFLLREAIHNEELKRYSERVKSRINSASSLNVTGVESIFDGIFSGIYHPKSIQCGWPVYYHENNSNIRISYFGDDHQGQWRIQNLHPSHPFHSNHSQSNLSTSTSSSLDLIPIFKISIHGACFPFEISTKYPSSHWLLRSDDVSHLIWSMISKQEKYELFDNLKINEIINNSNNENQVA